MPHGCASSDPAAVFLEVLHEDRLPACRQAGSLSHLILKRCLVGRTYNPAGRFEKPSSEDVHALLLAPTQKRQQITQLTIRN